MSNSLSCIFTVKFVVFVFYYICPVFLTVSTSSSPPPPSGVVEFFLNVSSYSSRSPFRPHDVTTVLFLLVKCPPPTYSLCCRAGASIRPIRALHCCWWPLASRTCRRFCLDPSPPTRKLTWSTFFYQTNSHSQVHKQVQATPDVTLSYSLTRHLGCDAELKVLSHWQTPYWTDDVEISYFCFGPFQLLSHVRFKCSKIIKVCVLL